MSNIYIPSVSADGSGPKTGAGVLKAGQRAKSRKFDTRLDASEGSEVAEFEGFARDLRRYYEAVAALEYEWSDGQVEGQINRQELIKRQMYGWPASICAAPTRSGNRLVPFCRTESDGEPLCEDKSGHPWN